MGDEANTYIPGQFAEEAEQFLARGGAVGHDTRPSSHSQTPLVRKVPINIASYAELCLVPGISDIRA